MILQDNIIWWDIRQKIIYTYYIIDKITFHFSYVSWGFTHLLYT